jgi:hypothetical protein
MPIYEVTQEETGITLELEGERPPKKEDIDRAFAFAGAQKYPNAPVLQAPPSLLEQAKAVAPSFARVAAPLAFGTPMPQDVATIGRTLQKVTGQEPKPEMLDAASRIDREGMMALLSASPEKRELGARLGSQLADIARIVSPGVAAIPQSATRAGGEVAGQVAADLLSPMNLMTLGIGGAARGAAAIPEVVEGVSRAGAISDVRRAAEAARASQILEEGIPAALAPEVTRGAIGSTGAALEALADPNVSPEEKLKTSLEAAVSTLFAAGLGAQVGRTFGFKRGVTQAEVLEGIASRKQTVGEAISKVSGLIDEMDRLVEPPTLERIREGFTELRQQLNPDEPFVYRPETIGEGPRAQVEGGMLPPREVVEPEVPSTLRTQDEILQASLRARDERIAAEQQRALEREAAGAGTPLRTAKEAQAEMAARRQRVREQAALIREGLRRELTPEEVMIEQEVQPRPSARQIAEELRRQIEPRIEAPEVLTEPRRAREGGLLPQREAIVEESVQEGTPLRSAEDIMAERLRARDERVAAEQQRIAAEQARVPLETASEKLARALESRDRRLAAEAAAEALESGAARGESVRVTRATVEKLLRMKEKPAGQSVAEETIFNEVWNKALEETQGKSKVPEWNGTKQVPGMWKYNTEGKRFGLDVEYKLSPVKKIPTSDIKSGEFDSPLTGDQVNDIAAILKSDPNQIPPIVVEINESGQLVVVDGEHRFGAANAIGLKEIPVRVAMRSDLPTKQYAEKANQIAQKLEGLRVKVEPGVGANPFPQLMGAAWNGALSVAQAVIRAGGSVADGVAAGIRYAKQNFRESFDENEFSNQLTRTIQTPAEIKAPPVMEPRRFAERVAAAPGVPPVIREAVAASPEAVYRQQNVAAEVADASTKTDRQLAADIIDPESNTRVISGMEQFNRQIASGDMEGATKTALSLSKSGTTWGQLINQFKLLKSASREGVIQLVTKSLEQNKRKPMTPKQAEQLGTAMDQYKIAQDAATAARVEGRGAFESNNPAEIQSAIDRINAADTLRMEADVALNETISKINPSSAADLFVSLVQGSVMAPISIVRNVVGNAINLPLRETADITSSLIDMALFGSKNNAYNYRSRLLDRIKAFGQSLPAAQKAILRGSNANPYELGTSIGNPLNFQRAWKNLYEAMSGEYRGNVARNIVEATVGVMPDIMLRLTQATDIPFKQANRAAIVSELGRMRGLTESQIKLALKDPELALISDQARANGRKGFTADDINTIETEAARSVFQQDNSATRMVAGINRFIKQETGSLGYVPYRLISLFQKTPINVAAEALQFTPAGVLRNWSKMSVRDREQAVGRLIVGSMVMGAFSYLYDKGIVTPNLDTPGETNKARELAKAGGVMPPGTINVSALRRLTSGQDPSFQPGDTVKDLSALGTMGALGIIVGSSKRIAERSRTDEPDFFALGKGSALSGINFVMEQQFLKGTSDLIKLMSEESGASLERFVKNLAVTAASPVAPSTLGSIRRAEREYLPVTGGEGIIKDTVNELNQRFAALGLAIPGTKDPNAMPVRRDLWGEAVEQTPKGNNPWVYQFLSFAKNREIDADPLNASIYRVWRRTADNKALPSVPNPQLTYKNQTFERMTPEQFDRYAQLVGFYRRKFSERAFMSGAYQQRGDESRIKLLSEAYDNGLKLGKLRFLKELRESGQTLTPVAPRRGFEE